MSDGDNSDFLDDPKAYEDEQSDVFSGLSRRGSESYNQPPEELNLRKQDSGAKNPNMVVDLKTRLRKNTSESSEPMMTRHDNPIPPPPMYNPPISHHMPPQQVVEHSGKPVVEIGMRLKSIYPQRYFIFKNMKPQHFKFCKENNYGITQKTNENTLKSAFENSENLLIIFSNTEQRSFLGYARMESDYFDAPEMIDNFTKNSGLTRVDFDNNFIFRIEWKTKNTLRYEFVNHIKNRYNENREVNHSKVFQEVDPAAGKALIALLENPPTEPIAEHEPPEHKRDEQPPMPFHKAPKVEGGNFPPNNFMMNNPMMPPHFGYYPMNPMNPMGGQMPGMGMGGPMGGQAGMFPGMPGQPGMMGGMPKQFPYNMNYNDYYMNMQQQQQQQQQQMMKQNKDKGRKKSASSSGSSSRSSSGSSRSSSPKKGSAKGGRRDSKSASRSRSKSHKRQNKMEKRGGGNTYQKDYQKDYQKGGRKYDNQNPHQNYPHQNKGKFQKFDKFDKFDKNNNYNNNKNNYRGGGNNPHNRRRNSRSGSPNNRNNNPKNRFNNKNQRRSNSRSAERRHTPEDQHKEENFETQQQPERETHQQETQSPIVQRERSLSNHNEEDPFDFGDMEDRISEGGNDRKVEEERQESPHAFDEDIKPGKRRSGSRSNKRSGSASSSKSVTESKSTTTKNQDIDFRGDSQRKKKFSRDDEPLVITKGNNKIIGGKGGTERLIIGKPNKHNSKQRSPDRSERSERFERHDRHERYDRHRNDRNDRRRSKERERNNSSRKSRERDASRDRRDANRDRRETQRERRDDKREEPKERRDEGYESKSKETPRREREPERSVESSETKGKRIDLRERLTQKDSIAPGSGSITNRIIKKN